MPKLTAPK